MLNISFEQTVPKPVRRFAWLKQIQQFSSSNDKNIIKGIPP